MSDSDSKTISVAGLGEVPAPDLFGRNKVTVPRSCPVTGCEATSGNPPSFRQMAGHFGRVTAENGPLAKAHREFGLQKSDYE
jgi:hypothetical protein